MHYGRWRPKLIALLVTSLAVPLAAPAAHGAEAAGAVAAPEASADALPGFRLKSSTGLQSLLRERKTSLPSFLSADRISGRNDVEVKAEGGAVLRQIGTELSADTLTYWPLQDETEAVGRVRLLRDDEVITGPRLRLRLGDSVGSFTTPDYAIRREVANRFVDPGGLEPPKVVNLGTGHADQLDFEGEGHYRLRNATYSTCKADGPGWYARVGDLALDYDREEGEGTDGAVYFQGVPILYSPWLSFALNNQRASGVLPPTFGSTSTGGLEFTLPYYWNIAPNMDATLFPRVMAKRGVQLATEFRYLDYGGTQTQARVEVLPGDHLFENRSRSAYAITHTQNLGGGFVGSVNLNGASDNTYFSDLANRLGTVSQTNLLRQGVLRYYGPWWTAAVTAEHYQTLQDPLNPVVPPYSRLPQLTLNALRPDLPGGLSATFAGEYVDFSHPTQVLGQRMTLYPQFSLPWQTAAVTVTPKLGFQYTHYALSRQDAGTPNSLSRALPIFSVDSSVVLERPVSFFDQNLTQTLEPHLYYLYVPVRDQSRIPNFDSALFDFNFSQIFSENRYAGGDRMGDANQLTAAAVSRLTDPATGAELLRAAIGQRYYFAGQQVTLPGEVARTSRNADILAAVSGAVAPKTYVDSGWQYNPRDHRTERFTVAARYQPELGRVLNLGYRYTRDQVGQIDLATQWPVIGGWRAVARYNYSTKDHRVIETVAGVEYDAGCWVFRAVAQRVATLTNNYGSAFFLQLELNGFSRLGSNPMEILKRSVPGYGRALQPAADLPFGNP